MFSLRPQAKWLILFYKDRRGFSPVDNFLNGLQPEEQAKTIMYLGLLAEYGILLGMPYAKALTGQKPLWELRPVPIRLIYFAHTGRKFIVLHGFRKKANKIDKLDIQTAQNRMSDFLERES